ncbi:MAG: YeeE/YedE family protein [Alphaproteobacteria bacterium]|nr:MAG: YeeE/YedE family protein [Alphaproteobacteria bacterium]
MLIQKNWSPYISGVIIGLLQIPIAYFFNATLGTSTSYSLVFEQLAALFQGKGFEIVRPNYVWQLGLVFGVIVGACWSARLSGAKYPEISPIWKKEFGITSQTTRYALSFFGGMFLIFGARLAQGCTSGNGISGVAQMDASAWVTLMAMFAFAILTVQLMRMWKGK